MSRLNNLYLFLNDEKGRTLPRAKLFFYENNSFNFKNTYADKALTSVNPNPVIADGAGRFPNIFLEADTYRVVLQDEDGVEISTKDDVDNLLSDGDLLGTSWISSLNTVSQMVAETRLSIGDRVRTSGYTTSGGGNDYEIVAGGTGTADGGSFIDLDNGLQAKGLFLDGVIRATQFGVLTTGDSSTKLKNMWEYANGSPTRIDTSCLSSTKIDLSNTDVECKVDDDVIIDCSGLPTGTALGEQYFLKSLGSVADSSLVTVDVEPYSENRDPASTASEMEVADGTKFAEGDTILLRSDQLFDDLWSGSTNNKRGELLKVKSVSSNTVTVADKIRFSYAVASNAVVEKLSPIKFVWNGGKAIGGGVGEGHSFLILDIAEDVQIDAECDYFEDTGFAIQRTYISKINAKPNYCTSPSGLGNTGYGVALLNGSRYNQVNAVGIRCRHIVTGGGTYPALDTVVTGMSIDCGIGTNAWDCHEPCFNWIFDVISRGGDGGIVVRGSDITVSIETSEGQATGIRVRTFATVTEQFNIHLEKVIVKNHKGSAGLIQGADAPLRRVTGNFYKSNNTRLDGLLISGDVDGVDINQVDIRQTFLNDTEGGTSGVGFRILGTAKSVKNVHVNRLFVKETIKQSVLIDEAEGVEIGSVYTEDSVGNMIELSNSDKVKFLGGSIKPLSVNLSGVFSDTCTDIDLFDVEITGDAALSTQDGWRAVDTIGASMRGCRVLAGRHGAFLSGTSDDVILTSNDVRGVVNADKFNTTGLVNVVEANNLT